MKLSTISSLLVLLSVVSMVAIAPNAFADHTEVTIDSISGAGSDTECDATDNCWSTGRAVSIAAGGEITVINTDTVPHSLSSGTTSGATDYWPVVLVMGGGIDSTSFTLDTPGEYPFYCMVHPWMVGTIIVEDEAAAAAEAAAAEAAAAAVARDPAIDLVDTLNYSISSGSVSSIMTNSDDATLVVAIDTSDDGELSINLDSDYITAFDDGSYFVLVNGEEVWFSQDGNDLTIPYESGTEKIEIVGSVVVPEFGTIAMIVLAVAIVSIIVLTTKTRATLIPKL